MLLAACSLLASLLVAEIVVRVFLSERLDTSLLRERLEEHSIKQLIQPSAEPELYYELRPNLRTAFAGESIFTNERGYRIAGNELRSTGTPGSEGEAEPSVRIAILGDSTAFGWGVAYEDTYADQFRRKMQERTGAPIDVRNYSVPGYNASQEFATFVKRVAADPPDLVLLHHDHNDSEATGQQYPPDYFSPAYGDNFLRSALLKLAIREATALVNRAARFWNAEGNEYWLFRVSCGFPTELRLGARGARFGLEEGLGGAWESAICWGDAS